MTTLAPSGHVDLRLQSGESILERIASGDQSAVSECLAAYGGLVWSLARRFLVSPADAEDATQDIFLELWQKAGIYNRTLASEETFVAMVARRRLIDHTRRRKASLTTVAIEADSHVVSERSGQAHAELKDEAAKAIDCLEKLPSAQQSVLKLSIQQGQSHSSIGELLKMPLGTVKSYARRGLLQLRDCMGRNTALPSSGAH